MKSVTSILSRLLYATRWVQLPLYLGLIGAQLVYAFKFISNLWYLFHSLDAMNDAEIMFAVLNLIDIVMIANLIIMVFIGGYNTYISRLDVDQKPEWLPHTTERILKIKLSMAIVIIAMINLLQTMININNVSSQDVYNQAIILIALIIATLGLAVADKLIYGNHENH